MYLIFMQNQLLGYTYNEAAAKAFKAIAITGNFECSIITVKNDQLLYKQGMVKTPEHIENLVQWYRDRGYSNVSWKYIQFNRKMIPHFSYSFMKEFEWVYETIISREPNEDLDDPLHQ